MDSILFASLLIVVQIWDAINDPLIGYIIDADQRKYKRNKFLSYIFVGSVGLIVGGAICFIPWQGAPATAKVIIFICGYVVWDTDPDLIENHHILNNLCHELDKTRLTVIAAVSPCPIDSPYVHISDIVSYNHYFGWYGGDTSMNGPWFDRFHEKYPNLPIGCSEYGCEALDWHTSKPAQGDYTEEYQSFYHEELIRQLFTRKYIWATHVWNMFDFGADARSEGGENGQNHKELVTFDRKYKKDSFYAYKAWLSDEPFVHLCSKRYVNREEDVTKVTVYSNQPIVELFANGISLGKKEGEYFFLL